MPREVFLCSRKYCSQSGEIALRIIRACKEMGIRPWPIHSTAELHALHVRFATRRVYRPAKSADSYLNVPASSALPRSPIPRRSSRLRLSCRETRALPRWQFPPEIKFIGRVPRASSSWVIRQGARDRGKAGSAILPGSAGVSRKIRCVMRWQGNLGSRSSSGGCRRRRKRHAGGHGRSGVRFRVRHGASQSPCLLRERRRVCGKIHHPARHIEIQIIADERGTSFPSANGNVPFSEDTRSSSRRLLPSLSMRRSGRRWGHGRSPAEGREVPECGNH